MSDSNSSSESGSGTPPAFRPGKKAPVKKAPSKSATKAKSAKTTASAAPTKRRKVGKTYGTTKVGPAFLDLPPSLTNSYRRRTARAHRKYMKEHPSAANSYNGLTKTAAKRYNATKKAKMYQRLGKKLGRDLGIKDKRVVEKAIEEASISGSPNVVKVLQRIRGPGVFAEAAAKGKLLLAEQVDRHKKSIAAAAARVKANANAKNALEKAAKANAKKAGKDAYAAKIAFAKDQEAAHAAALEEAIGKVTRQFERQYTGTTKIATPKDINQVATLRAHGFSLSAADHIHLKKHLRDAATAEIVNRLDAESQLEGKNACAVCDLDKYLLYI